MYFGVYRFVLKKLSLTIANLPVFETMIAEVKDLLCFQHVSFHKVLTVVLR